MRLPLLAHIALVSAVSVAAASCTTYSYYPPPANIYLTWTFAGGGCASAPGVVTVKVSIPNDPVPISPDTFACSAGNPPSALALYGYVPGSYVVNLTAQDATGAVLWAGSQTVVVNGLDVYATIDLQPVAPFLSWTFAPAVGTAYPPCTALNDPDPDRLDSVALYVDGAATPAAIYDCSAGTGGSQVAAPALSGNHVLQLVGYQDGLADSFAQTDPVTVNFSTATSQSFTFQWLVGGIGVAWTFTTDPNACTSGSVASVSATFSGPGGYGLSGFACATPVAVFKALSAVSANGSSPVSYSLGVSAYPPGSGVSPLYTGVVNPVTISPGVFYDGTTATVVTVPLN